MKIIDCVYLPMTHKLAIIFDEGAYLRIPCHWITEFTGCSNIDIQQLEFSEHVPSIHIEHKDIDINLRGLVIHYLDHIRMSLDPEGDYPLYLRKHP